jgi:ADA HAT complex component 1
MQSMFRLPWCNESPGDKIMEKSTLHKQRPMPVVDMPNFMNKIKRKRTDSPEPSPAQHAHVVKKWKDAHGDMKPSAVAATAKVAVENARPGDAPTAASAHVSDARPKAQPARKESKSKASAPQQHAAKPDSTTTPATTTMDSVLTPVQQAIEAQINYEILLKHNELRLIEQELAKCQVSLEQLRRCSLIPFPGTEGLNLDVSLGVGPSLQPSAGYTQPQYAAPWGVTDGPYTRHYAKWLISDVKFDPVSERALAQQAQGYFGNGEGRTTRGSFADYGSAHRGRTSRTSTGMLKLTPLGETPAPAPKVDPLLHKRSTDGQWVRLYCAQCGHSNFSNTQGFLNHCRIKHNQVFKSHDAAAIACGVPVESNDAPNPVAASEPASMPAATPAVSFPTPATPGIVHPLAAQAAPVAHAPQVHRQLKAPSSNESKPAPLPSSIKTSSTPYLAARFQNSGAQGDFKEILETARSKIDLDAIDTSDDDSADNSVAPTPVANVAPHLARLPASAPANKTPARAGSKKGSHPSHARLPMSLPSPIKPQGHDDMPHSPVDLSPNTVESNPGLVSDHDDDDDDDADDAHSQLDLAIDDHVMVEDSSDIEGVQERRGSRPGLHGCFEKGEGSREH